MTRLTLSFLAGVAWALGCLNTANAQNYAIDWFSIDGGGGTSVGGPYSVSGTIGQPDAGMMSGGAYTLVGGFWGIVNVIQTPGAPLLSIKRETTGGNVMISWPLPGTGFILEETPSLNALPASWTPVTLPYQTNATDIFISVPAPMGNKFYRLQHQ